MDSNIWSKLIRKAFVVSVLLGFMAGLEAQFIWKIIYFPEPLIPVVVEMCGIVVLAGLAIWFEVSK